MNLQNFNKFWKHKTTKEKSVWKQRLFDLRLYFMKPEIEKFWTVIYYGRRGSGKTLHQAKMIRWTLSYLKKLYKHYPKIDRAIIVTDLKLSYDFRQENKAFLYFFDEIEQLEHCPRKNCWKGKEPHRLHHCYLIFDDISRRLPKDSWELTPSWLKDYFIQGRKLGIHCLASMVNADNVDISFRRCTDIAYKFRRIIGNKDPDESKNPVRFIFGVYMRRFIDAEDLWNRGNLSEREIQVMMANQELENEKLKRLGKGWAVVLSDNWLGRTYFYTKSLVKIFDTHNIVKSYKPTKMSHHEITCGVCGKIKIIHDIF